MRNLGEILANVSISEAFGSLDLEIEQINFDSRCISGGDLFVAIRGAQVDGHRFIDAAILAGAKVIVCEKIPGKRVGEITYIRVENSAIALGHMAADYYHNPSRKLYLIGITGTNGKTTTVTLLHELFTLMGYKAGLLSTVENRIGKQVIQALYTTPDALQLNGLLSEMVDAGCDYAFMEVSSHAIDQSRIAGIHFRGGIFTNITHDHLDYHKSFKAYIDAKKKFFDGLPAAAFALSNIDDKRGTVMLQNTPAEKSTYGLKKMADFKARIIENTVEGLQLEIDGVEFYSRLIGDFNAYNLLAAYAAAILLEFDKTEVLTQLSNLKAAEGRFDYQLDPRHGITSIVDYAHTPDALEKVLLTIEKLRRSSEKVITVCGAGGDRDKAKRPVMAKVACQYSDLIILTSDNPRSEDPQRIIEDMEKGIPKEAMQRVLSIVDRRQAIRTACQLARRGDIILVAGKGHEKYQEIKGNKLPFDDKSVLKEALEMVQK